MPVEGSADRGVTARMANIRRKPVSSAFYASDFPPIFAPDSPHPQTAERDGARLSHHLRLELNNSSDTTLYGGDPVTAGSESHVSLLDVYNRTTSLEAGSQSPDPAITESRTTYEASYIEDVSELPTDDNHSGRDVQPAKPRPQGSSDNYPTRQLWTPIWLKKRTLVAFVVLYIILLLSVILLWHFSRDRDGFAPRISTNHYTWTYGPTAVLVIVVGLWRQVAYYSSVLAPWHEMKRGAESSRSLLLGYVSPFQVIIFSTGLLVLSPIVVTNSTYPIEVRTDLDVTSLPIDEYLAYPSIGAKATLPPNSEISVEADVMLPQFDCEAAKAIPGEQYSETGTGPYYHNFTTFEAPSCVVKNVFFSNLSLGNQTYPSRQIIGHFLLVDCISGTIYYTETGSPLLQGQNDVGFMATVADYRYMQTPAYQTHGDSTSFEDNSFWVTLDRANGVICKPAYSIIKANVTYDTAKQDESDRYSISKPEVPAGKRLENSTVNDLSLALCYAIDYSQGIIGGQQRRLSTDIVEEWPDILSRLMLLTQGESSLEVFLADIETMKSAAAKTLCGIASQYAQQFLLKPASKTSIASFRIQASDTQPMPNIAEVPSKSSHWHHPIAIQKGFIAGVLPLPLIFIAVLEGLQHASDHHNGFLPLQRDTAHESSSINILIRYIPAFVVLLLATLFNMLDFTVTTFTPFSALRSGSSAARRSIFSQLMSRPPPVALYRAAIDRQFGALFSNIAGLAGPLLAIIVSGLLIIENFSVSSNVTVQQLDSFNINTHNADYFHATETISIAEKVSMMEIFNLSSPAFTYKDLAFPHIELSEESMGLVKAASATGNSHQSSVNHNVVLVNTFRTALTLIFLTRNSLDPQIFRPDALYFVGTISGTFSPEIRLSDCPSFAFIFGNVKARTTSYENVTFMTCSEHIQEVQAQVTFTLPYFTLDQSHPPIIDESTIRLLKNSTSGLTAIKNNVIDKIFHSFFHTLVSSSDATPPEELVGPANAAKLFNHTNYLYKMQSAPLQPNPIYNATIALPTTRLKMNNGSKVTLQILLAVMFVCGSLAYLLTDMRRTLPHNPCTLAGSMSLLAGSEMASRAVVHEGAEWMSDEELKKAGVFEGYLFSLGWWND
ncbi:hypothetical protein EPUS_03178 [Endocarpon pusillum Z07020]|uniref:Uncharacterized protein n=1 Tax=Endocarpon pusillum (strain Z07020 / HMAS-L-300199) TaxID=1263415 RepID=U1HZ26_ENDPU|nr:uncharacterized protein EPUS_03178 [Endocarpon pusillum Z07020]ERF74794.1 hypothetical protein EPUS_03178 [Endocarpon pusillum Z07020]